MENAAQFWSQVGPKARERSALAANPDDGHVQNGADARALLASLMCGHRMRPGAARTRPGGSYVLRGAQSLAT